MGTAEKLCYACTEPATTREHYPPDSFFPAGNNVNLTTVPSCKLHNNANSKDVEYVRNIITTVLGVNQVGESHFLDKSMLSFDHSPNLLNATFADIRPVQINGGTSGVFTVNVERVEAVMEACVRAIHFAETSERCGGWKIVVPNLMFKDGVPDIEHRNPIALVRVKGGSKRRQRPTTLTVEEFELIVATLQEPWRLMVQIAQCLGLRVSEIAALQWDDFDFDKNQLLVQRSFVNGRVDDVKTEYSQDYVPLHPSLTEIVLKWSTQAVPTEEGWVFANPRTNRPYYPTEIQKRHLRPSGCCVVECPMCGAAPGVWCNQDQKTGNGVRMLLHETRVKNSGKYGGIGWHTFRHTYRSWLDETGAPMKVQQELMRHASIQTTMNVYGQAMSSSKREANGKVVEMVLKPLKASA